MIDRNRNRFPEEFRSKGMTLLELLAVTVALGVVAWVVIPRFTVTSIDSKGNACYVLKRDIEVQTELWYRNKGTWPADDLSDMGADKTYFPEGLRTCPVDGSAYMLDGTTHRVIGHDHAPP